MDILFEYKMYLLNVQQRADATAKAYLGDVKQFIMAFPNFKDVQRKDLVAYISSLKDKYEPSAIMRKVASIQSFWQFLVDTQVVSENIAKDLPRPKMRNKVVVCPDKDELEEILYKAKVSRNDTLELAIQLGAYVGLRLSEAITLKLEDIDFKTGIATLYDTKTAESAEIAIDKQTLSAILTYTSKRGNQEGCILRTAYNKEFAERNFLQFIKKYMDINFHQLRKYCATSIANNPNAGLHIAMHQLRHKTINTTMRYVKKDMNHMQSVLNGMREE